MPATEQDTPLVHFHILARMLRHTDGSEEVRRNLLAKIELGK